MIPTAGAPSMRRVTFSSRRTTVKSTKNDNTYTRGMLKTRCPVADVQEKYLYNALRLVSQEKAQTLMRQIMSIEQLSNIRELTEQLRF